MNLVPISNKYSIDIEKYAKIKEGDVIKSQSQLRKMICYPEITIDEANNGTVKALQPILDKFIKYEKISVNGHKIRIKSLKLPQEIKELAENYLKSTKTKESRIIYRHNRKYLLDNIIHSYNEVPAYLTTYQIIQHSTVYHDFFYEYHGIYYDRHFPTKEKSKELDEFVTEYAISDKECLIEVMETLSNILYRIFKRDNIYSWAKKQDVEVNRVLYQSGNELDSDTSEYLETYYFQPLRDMGIPAKSITGLANKYYMEDYNLTIEDHKFFYYTYKFTKPDTFKVKVDVKDFMQNQFELSDKALKALKVSFYGTISSSGHATSARNFDEIINKIKMGK